MTYKKKDILIISHFVDFPWEKGNDRFIYIANELIKNGSNVELVTSDFIHNQKKHRKPDLLLESKLDTKITLLHEEGYKKNISIKRLTSHKALGIQLREYLKTREKPDIIYSAVPSLDLAWEASLYAEKNQIEFIIDIQDLWPEAFEMIFPCNFIRQFLFLSAKNKANYIYSRADKIVAVSETYLKKGKKVNKKADSGISVFLGTDFKLFKQYKENYKLPKRENEIWIVYVGTLGHSYNLTEVIEALGELQNLNLRFVILGDGPLRKKFEQQAKKTGILHTFTGRLEYPKMVSLLCQCDIAVNPIRKGAASIINKVGDYAAAGLPVISTQECEEYRNLLKTYKCGFNCENGNIKELVMRIKLLAENIDLRKEMGENSRSLGKQRFDRALTYSQICQYIMK